MYVHCTYVRSTYECLHVELKKFSRTPCMYRCMYVIIMHVLHVRICMYVILCLVHVYMYIICVCTIPVLRQTYKPRVPLHMSESKKGFL